MRSLSLYIVLVLAYLGLSKSFSLSNQATAYIFNEQVYSNFFLGSPLVVVLAEQFKTGFLIKTHFHRYLVIHGFKDPEEIVVRTHRKHFEDSKKFVGLSIFRRSENSEIESSIPLPPGSLYLGDARFGRWKRSNDGKRRWFFHRAYKNFPKTFGWNDFRPSKDFLFKVQEAEKIEQPFFGEQGEFGPQGKITLASLIKKNKTDQNSYRGIRNLFQQYLQVPPWKIKNSIRELIETRPQPSETTK